MKYFLSEDMKRFFSLILLFTSPFIFLALVTFVFYTKSGGDLNRLGKIAIRSDYRKTFNFVKNNKKFSNLSDINLKENTRFNILTIGDSFSNRECDFGYQKHLAKISNMNVINFDKDKYEISSYNPIEFLYQIINGDLLKKTNVDYIILQSVEREIIQRSFELNKNKIIYVDSLKHMIKPSEHSEDKFLFTDIFKFPYFNILYNFNDRAFSSKAYKLKLTKELFSTRNNSLLFYYKDLKNIKYIKKDNVKNLNNELNLLAKKLKQLNIRLIVLPSPDKYDLYCDYISNNKYPKNLFFDYMQKENKDYIYIDTKKLLGEHLKQGEKDIYFADDTHWSPKVSKIIAKKIFDTINKKSSLVKNDY